MMSRLAPLALGLLVSTPAAALRLDPQPIESWNTLDRMAAVCDRQSMIQPRLDRMHAEGDEGAADVQAVMAFCEQDATKAPTEAQWVAAAALAFPSGIGVRSTAAAPEIASGGASWQSAAIDGLTAMILDRAKAELTLSFAQGLAEIVCDDAPTARYFADTCAILDTHRGDDPLPVFGGVLRAAVATDVGRWPDVLVEGACGAGLLARAALEVGAQVTAGHDPIATLAALDSADAGCDDATAKAMRTLGTAVRRLAPAKTRTRSTRPAAFLYDGLAEELGVDARVLRALNDRLVHLRKRVAAAQEAPTDGAAFAGYVNATVDVLGTIDALMPADAVEAGRTRTLLRRVQSVQSAVRHADYGQAVVDILGLAKALDVKLPPKVSRYAGFVADLAAARTAEDITGVLENAAVPLGLWKHKRKDGVTTVVVNAYLGIGAGGELVSGDRAPDGFTGQAGLFVPVGVEVSRGFDVFSVGALISVLDLGTVAQFRLTETEADVAAGTAAVDQNPAWTVEQVLAPGVWAVAGFTTVAPISVGVGVTMSPKLRTGEWATVVDGEDSVEQSALNAFRIGAFIAIDVPLFSL